MQQLLIERFQNYLLDSGLSTGDPIPKEIELAEMFEVSRSDIREVIQHFAQLGLLKRVKKRGTVIQELNEDALNRSFIFCLQMGGFYFEEMKEVRIIMETAIAPLIVSRITPENLEKLNIKPFGAPGDTFDPNLHNAILHVDDEAYGEGEIVEVLQGGYMYGEKVIRYAMVKVAN